MISQSNDFILVLLCAKYVLMKANFFFIPQSRKIPNVFKTPLVPRSSVLTLRLQWSLNKSELKLILRWKRFHFVDIFFSNFSSMILQISNVLITDDVK